MAGRVNIVGIDCEVPGKFIGLQAKMEQRDAKMNIYLPRTFAFFVYNIVSFLG